MVNLGEYFCRKKRKWDQPAESFVAAAAAGLIVPGILPLSNLGSLAAVMVPGTSALTTTLLASPMVASSKIVSSVIPVASPVQQSSMVNSKLNQVSTSLTKSHAISIEFMLLLVFLFFFVVGENPRRPGHSSGNCHKRCRVISTL